MFTYLLVEVDCHRLGSLGPSLRCPVSLLVAGETDVCWHWKRTSVPRVISWCVVVTISLTRRPPCVGRVGSDGEERGLGVATDGYYE